MWSSHISHSWWSFTGIWVIASFLKFPGIFSVYNNAVGWMVSARSPVFKSSNSLITPLKTVPSTTIIIGITVTFYSVFSFLVRVQVLIPHMVFFNFHSVVWQVGKVHNSAGSLFLIITGSGRRAVIRWSVCISKSQRKLCVSFPPERIRVMHILLVHLVKFKLFAQFPIDYLSQLVMSSLILFFVLIYCIQLLCDWLLRFCHHIPDVY